MAKSDDCCSVYTSIEDMKPPQIGSTIKGGDTIVKVGGGGGGLRILCEHNIAVGVSPHHLGGSGGMLPQKIFEFGLSVSVSDAF